MEHSFKTILKEKAYALGFDIFGVTNAAPLEKEAVYLEKYLEKNFEGDMSFLSKNQDKRLNPKLLEPETNSIIVVGLSYNSHQKQKDTYKISKYAWGKDYHKAVKERLLSLIKFIKEMNPDCFCRPFVDTAPVMEKALAVNAGLGFIGKNGLFIHPELGSYIFLGEIFTSLHIDTDMPFGESLCGKCQKCIDACPTHAIVEPYILEANKCNSYINKNKDNNLFYSKNSKLDDWIFGCDICQDICPFNQSAKSHQHPDLMPHEELLKMKKEDWESLIPEKFTQLFKDTTVKDFKYNNLIRNIKSVSEPNKETD